MTFELGQLAQLIHVTDDLAAARRFFGDILGGQSYYEGYSPYEKRDASIYAIGDVTIEPMSPSSEPGAAEMPVGRFLTRFGPRWQSIAINTTGVPELAEHLISHGVRVVGPGGTPLSDMAERSPMSIYTHPRDTRFLIEFVDFGAPLMPASPRLSPDWDLSRWSRIHPLGLTGWSHVVALVRNVDASVDFFVELLGVTVLDEPATSGSERRARIRLGSEAVIELVQPVKQTEMARSLERDGEGLHSVVLNVNDLDQAATYLASRGVSTSRTATGSLLLAEESTAGAAIELIVA